MNLIFLKDDCYEKILFLCCLLFIVQENKPIIHEALFIVLTILVAEAAKARIESYERVHGKDFDQEEFEALKKITKSTQLF